MGLEDADPWSSMGKELLELHKEHIETMIAQVKQLVCASLDLEAPVAILEVAESCECKCAGIGQNCGTCHTVTQLPVLVSSPGFVDHARVELRLPFHVCNKLRR